MDGSRTPPGSPWDGPRSASGCPSAHCFHCSYMPPTLVPAASATWSGVAPASSARCTLTGCQRVSHSAATVISASSSRSWGTPVPWASPGLPVLPFHLTCVRPYAAMPRCRGVRHWRSGSFRRRHPPGWVTSAAAFVRARGQKESRGKPVPVAPTCAVSITRPAELQVCRPAPADAGCRPASSLPCLV